MKPSSHLRRAALRIATLATCALSACGEERAPHASPTASRELIQSLFESRDPARFAAALATARKAKVHPQTLLEARFLFYVDHGRYEEVAALAPALVAQGKVFRIEDSTIFSVPEEFFAIAQETRRAAEQGEAPPPRLLYTESELKELRKLQTLAGAEREWLGEKR